MKELHNVARELVESFSKIDFCFIERTKNYKANQLANQGRKNENN